MTRRPRAPARRAARPRERPSPSRSPPSRAREPAPMNIVVFGLTVSSSWGNGHATLWRGLARALDKLDVRLTFFERHQPYYAAARDGDSFPGIDLVLYDSWA